MPQLPHVSYKLSRERRRALIDLAAGVLRFGEPTLFALEATCRHGLRSNLCLQSFRRSGLRQRQRSTTPVLPGVRSDVHWECIYRSVEECRPNVLAGNRGFCNPNPYFVPSYGPAGSKQRRRGARPQ